MFWLLKKICENILLCNIYSFDTDTSLKDIWRQKNAHFLKAHKEK